jgi:hypothetical protein
VTPATAGAELLGAPESSFDDPTEMKVVARANESTSNEDRKTIRLFIFVRFHLLRLS